jgi:hypothetical protein
MSTIGSDGSYEQIVIVTIDRTVNYVADDDIKVCERSRTDKSLFMYTCTCYNYDIFVWGTKHNNIKSLNSKKVQTMFDCLVREGKTSLYISSYKSMTKVANWK